MTEISVTREELEELGRKLDAADLSDKDRQVLLAVFAVAGDALDNQEVSGFNFSFGAGVRRAFAGRRALRTVRELVRAGEPRRGAGPVGSRHRHRDAPRHPVGARAARQRTRRGHRRSTQAPAGDRGSRHARRRGPCAAPALPGGPGDDALPGPPPALDPGGALEGHRVEPWLPDRDHAPQPGAGRTSSASTSTGPVRA